MERGGAARFPTTRWSRVIAAAGSGAAGREALERLCETYWYPLYAFARRSGRDAERALDLTQGFFARLLDKTDLDAVDRERGRFRSWLLAGLKHFMANEWDREKALKRGGAVHFIAIDSGDAEGRYQCEPQSEVDAERLYDRRWAFLIIEGALAALRSRCKTAAERAFVDRMAPFLAGQEIEGEYEALAAELDTTPGALKTRLSRSRDRFWALVRAEVAETLENPDEVDDELRYLIEVVGSAW